MTKQTTAKRKVDVDLDDLIWGAEKIAAAANLKPRQAYPLLERGIIPANKPGGKVWCTTLRNIRSVAERQED